MRIPQPIISFSCPPQTITVLCSGSGEEIEVTYIRCLNGWVPKCYELWALAEDVVFVFNPLARVELLSEFREDNFHTHFYNSQQSQIPFLGRRAMNDSFEFLDVFRTTQHVRSHVNYTPNIFVHSWGINPTDMFPPNISTINQHAYNTIVSFHGFVLRSNHERLRLKCIELKRIRAEEYLPRIRQDVSDEVAANVRAPGNNALGDNLSNDSDSDDGWLERYNSD